MMAPRRLGRGDAGGLPDTGTCSPPSKIIQTR